MITRDESFYDEDGNVVFRADDTLFRVHRSRLSRSSIVFKSLFDLPPEDSLHSEGSSEQRPIVLSDDVEDVRALLWALHLLHAISKTCTRLLRVSRLAHKYEFEHLDRWALETAFAFLGNHLFDLSHSFISQLFEVTRLCAPDDLSVAEDIIRSALECKRADLAVVLTTADAHGLPSLAGYAYHRTLLSGTWLRDASLPPQIRTNLLAGYHACSELWLELRRTPPAITRHVCKHLGPCLWMWGEVWRKAAASDELLALPPADVLGKLRAVKACAAFAQECSGTWPENRGTLTFVCRAGAAAAIDERIADIESRLIDFFRLPPVDAPQN
ncbi:hypothetical protein AURDEDRAFT_169563 [Auricularia subglabra TFB-10046 SS5]|uniref:BTB domain-containing protein n=1 Tax=Auricularia subglabra (strain TFB-10046 / SS5) TaxID=717982 RepID=J0WYT0_AURST|nr:hypothetical protein AURDEDRAFT_169563 [Auricularia subglabra TFB-10046 SS5]